MVYYRLKQGTNLSLYQMSKLADYVAQGFLSEYPLPTELTELLEVKPGVHGREVLYQLPPCLHHKCTRCPDCGEEVPS